MSPDVIIDGDNLPDEPSEPCEEGQEWQYQEVPYPPYMDWVCVKIPTAPISTTPVPPPEPEDPADWPWPFNLAQAAIEAFFLWLADIIEYGFDTFKTHFDGAIGDVKNHFSDVGVWLQGLLEDARNNINAFIQEKVSELGEGIKTLQAGIQAKIDELSLAIEKKVTELQEKAEEVIKERMNATDVVITETVTGTQTALETGIKDTQTMFTKSIENTQSAIETALDPEEGFIPTLVKEVPRSLLSFVGGLAAPFLRQLNATLEAT